MGRRYSIDGSDTNTDNTTIITLISAATIRPKIYDLVLGAKATPQDYSCGYELNRCTTTGTPGSSVTPQALDPGDPTPLATAGEAHSAEPTYTADAIMLYFACNQRATFRWVAAPDGEIVLPATASNGVGLVADSPSTAFAVQVCIHFEE